MLKRTDLRYILNLAENAKYKKKYKIAKKVPTYSKVVDICNTLNHDLSDKKICYDFTINKSFPYTKYNIYITFYDPIIYANHYEVTLDRYENKYKEELPLKIVLEDMIQTRFHANAKMHNFSLVAKDRSIHWETYFEPIGDGKIEFYRVFMY